MTSFEDNVERLLGAVEEANVAVLEVYGSGEVEVEYKADNSPLTTADLASNTILTRALTELFPDIPVVSEEGEDDDFKRQTVVEAEKFWLVDPLDGTHEFIKRSGDFTLCLALIEDGMPTFGIVSAPVPDVVYYGGSSIGASYRREYESEGQPIHVKRNEPGVVVCSRSFLNKSTQAYVAKYYPLHEQKQIGSQLKLPLIAEGSADVCPRLDTPQHLWDVAAGHAILVAAGGTVERLNGDPMNYRDPSLMAGDFIAHNRTI